MSTEKALKWWQTSIIYQIYPRSFCDSNGDGIGDLKGVTSKLDYLQYLNVGAVWLSPFFKSPMRDFGYDVSDFRDVDPIFGTLDDFDDLVQQAHERGIKVIVDFVPNHTSDHHDWFQRSCRREAPYDDYYIWHDGKLGDDGKPQPPNNWRSVFGGSAWQWHETRGQFYYHAFLAQQPDLNYRNPRVVGEMNEVVSFWLERGVDGLRVDAVDFLFETADVSQDDPGSNLAVKPVGSTTKQPEIMDVVRGWRQIFDQFQKSDDQSRFMVIETYAGPQWRNQYYSVGANPFNMDLCQRLHPPPLSGARIRALVEQEYVNLPSDGWPTFVLGNHDRPRVSSRFGAAFIDTLNVLLLTLRGTPCTYYGEELGLRDVKLTFQQTMDPLGKVFGPVRGRTGTSSVPEILVGRPCSGTAPRTRASLPPRRHGYPSIRATPPAMSRLSSRALGRLRFNCTLLWPGCGRILPSREESFSSPPPPTTSSPTSGSCPEVTPAATWWFSTSGRRAPRTTTPAVPSTAQGAWLFWARAA